ncbi:hypothetical protein SAMN05443667_11242 [Flavobacterium gillisiae]|uniref:Uncharacterized protein n=1 Tax=Flavobacterium gillisiae TaxID=150146 RepID=A0A1H4F7Q1_9FLAO|nr:hypothetical protein SAMN05443667_11242 [Flavobacterium gillisiae]
MLVRAIDEKGQHAGGANIHAKANKSICIFNTTNLNSLL